MPFSPGRPISIRMMSGRFVLADLHGLGSALGFAHDLKLFAVAQDGFDAIAHDFVIVDQENLKRHN